MNLLKSQKQLLIAGSEFDCGLMLRSQGRDGDGTQFVTSPSRETPHGHGFGLQRIVATLPQK
jgi:hypothetical protein